MLWEMRIAACLCVILLPLAAQNRGQPPDPIRKYLDHPGFQWKCKALDHVDLCFPPNTGPLTISSASTAAERELARMLRIAGADEYRPRIHLFLLQSFQSLKSLTGAYAAGASVPPEHAVFFVDGNDTAMAHELNHEVFTALWGESEPWIAEGLAASLSEPYLDAKARDLIAAGKARPLEDMVNPWWNASLYPSTVIYPELGSFVKYLRETYGIARLREVWHGGAASIPHAFGKPLDRLEREWRASFGPAHSH
jgi:hypothetical protein